MDLSVFDLFKVGLGPSSSHTVGPMLAGCEFARRLEAGSLLSRVTRVQVDLYGSLALTGRGHATDRAVILGLSGQTPATADPDDAGAVVELARATGTLRLAGSHKIPFDEPRDLVFQTETFLPFHPNGMRFQAFADRQLVSSDVVYSLGGGFIHRDGAPPPTTPVGQVPLPYPFASARELLAHGDRTGLSIAQILEANELARRTPEELETGIATIYKVMEACIDRGCVTGGVLPGGLGVERRAPKVARRLQSPDRDALSALDWVSLYALAVNEENAAGGRVVTAPTNGAAGVIPAVLAYHMRHHNRAGPGHVKQFLLTAAAVGMLYKRNASLSAAEVGCQGEVGVACSMAAAGLAAVMGGTNAQIENAAEIGMEHNLGLTCDPIGGLVQVPCIERNTMGAVKAINAARLAVLHGDGRHRVPLDRVIETMRQTGLDMQRQYKETSLGGLAVNVVDC